jgi:drug/metabolite transporter (DMT)-like permease
LAGWLLRLPAVLREVGVLTIAVRETSPPTVSTGASVLLRRESLIALAVCGLLAGVGGAAVVATSDHLVDAGPYAAQVVLMVVGTFAAALYWLVRRPDNRLGLALLGLGFATAVVSLREPPSR